MPFVGCPGSPRRQQSSPGHAPCEHNWPLRRPGPCPGKVSLSGTPTAGCLSGSRYRVQVPPVSGVGAASRRAAGVHCREPRGTLGCCLQPPGGGRRRGTRLQPGHSPSAALLPVPGACPNTPRRAPKVHGHLPAATTPPWPPRKGGRGSSLPGGSSRQSKAVTKRQHFGSACSEV